MRRHGRSLLLLCNGSTRARTSDLKKVKVTEGEQGVKTEREKEGESRSSASLHDELGARASVYCGDESF